MSYHKSKRIKGFLAKHKGINIFYLPPYAPEYNPVEQIWKWIKPLIHGSRTADEGIEDLIARLRRLCWHWKYRTLANAPNIGLGIWEQLL